MQRSEVEATAKTQRRRARRKPAGSSVICIQTKDGMNRVNAAVVDVIDGGYGVNLRTPLKPGSPWWWGNVLKLRCDGASPSQTARFARGWNFWAAWTAMK